MKKLFVVALLLMPGSAWSQGPVTVTLGTPSGSVPRPGIVLGGPTTYGNGQILKSLNYANLGYLPQGYWETSFYCNGTGQTTTNWNTNIESSAGFPLNFWAGATFTVVQINSSTTNFSSSTSGTITASTAQTSGSPLQFTLGTALPTACYNGGTDNIQDVILVSQRSNNDALMAPANILNVTGTTSWSSTVSPASINQIHSLHIASGTATFYIDAVASNAMNTAVGGTQVPYINLNGSYSEMHKAECVTSGCSIQYSVGRIGSSAYVSGTDSPSTSSFATYSHSFTAAETGSQTTNLQYTVTCTGTCLIQDMDVIEGSTLSANTTPFRDAVFRELEELNPGSIRYMNKAIWAANPTDNFLGSRIPSNQTTLNGAGQYGLVAGLRYDWDLQLSYALGADAWITLSGNNTAADEAIWINDIGNTQCSICASGQTWNSLYAAKGLHIYTEITNEPWNSSATNSIESGNGNGYGHLMGVDVAAMKAATGYNSAVDKIVGNSQAAGGGYGSIFYGFGANALNTAGCTLSARTGCPDYMDIAPYTLNTVDNISNVYGDEIAELINSDTVPCTNSSCPASGSQFSNIGQAAFFASTYNVGTAVYEVSYGAGSGSASLTQLQQNQVSGSVQMGLTTVEHMLALQDQAGVGPVNKFALTNYQCFGAGVYSCFVGWDGMRYMAAGPGQLGSWSDEVGAEPVTIYQQVADNAIGTNSTPIPVSYSGSNSYSYAGGQGESIPANSAVPYIQCHARTNGSSAYTLLCFNHASTAVTVNFAGTGAPVSGTSVTKTIAGLGAGNALTDNNANSWIGNNSTAASVSVPTSSVMTGANSIALPTQSMAVLTYSLGGTPAATPAFSLAAGTYTATQTLTITDTTPGATIYYTTNGTTPTTSSTVYTAPLSISVSVTIKAIAAATGYLNSAVQSAAYTISTATAAVPVFSPNPGAYPTGPTVTISTTTAGATIYYTTNGSTPTTASSVYTAPITITGAMTIKAMAVAPGMSNSPVQSSSYSVSTVPCMELTGSWGLVGFTCKTNP